MIEGSFVNAPTALGAHNVKVSQSSKVYYPDGTSKTTDIAKVIISESKDPVTAYPCVLW